MASSAVVDLNALLAPISAENPAGEPVRYAGVYDAIQEARRADDELPMGDWKREAKAADWLAVIKLSTEALATKSKDLQLAVWLAEALVKRHGFPGVRDGLQMLQGLQETFWDGLYPEVEDGDLELRVGPLEWLNQKLPACIQNIALTQGNKPYSYSQWEESRRVDNLGRQDPSAMLAATAEGKITGEQFDAAVGATGRLFYEGLFEDLNQSKEELRKLESIVDQKFGRDAPSFIGIRKAIDDCHSLVSTVIKTKREQDPSYKPEPTGQSGSENVAESPASDSAMEVKTMAAPGAMTWSSEPKSREEAFQRLVVIANYLKRVEPQHPVSYLLERAVRWTKMPLEEWLGEVVRNDDVLKHLHDTLGIKLKENP
jgi:type VI secretion system protein ImpA